MKLLPFILTITLSVVIHIAIAGDSNKTSCNREDEDVMLKLRKSLSPPDWSGKNPCTWTHVQCDSTGHVTNITLEGKNLWGEVPPEITSLSRLEYINLRNNHIHGKLPPLANLADLEIVILDNNNFTSFPTLPFLKGLKNLQKLSMSNNPNLPPWELPETLSDSTTLVYLNLVNCNLKGHIPDIFESLASLQTLKLAQNNLTGPLPQSLSKSAMKQLIINDQIQGLNGPLRVLANMTNLYQVWLDNNQFVGPIPDLVNVKSLSDLQLHNNRLTGPVPRSLITLPKLLNISLGGNLLQGPRPVFPTHVGKINLEDNNFCKEEPGPCNPRVTTLLEIIGGFGYPQTFSDWKGDEPCNVDYPWQSVTCDDTNNVTVLNFAKQGFRGRVSPSIANLTSLEVVLLNNNKLFGTIPDLSKLTKLKVFDISSNDISGKVPSFEPGVLVNTSNNPNIGKDIVIPAPAPAPNPNKSYTDKYKEIKGKGNDAVNDTVGKKHKNNDKENTWLVAILGIALAIFVAALSLVIFMQFRRIRGRQEILAMHSRNGRESSHNGGSERGLEPVSRISCVSSDIQFEGGNVAVPIEVLRDVTNNFSKDNELGRGGFGVVYEGVLHDGTKIAVKRMEASVDSSKGLSEFQAEIAVLSKVRHRNLVALYGFCIQGNERLLVYEHMPQGTLGRQLFMHSETGVAPLTWKQRIQIALDVAKGVEYLHSLAHQSFIHRDLKPSNVLLGDDMRAKVSDFGLVKNAPDGKYSVETKLAGTFGYLAPEYASTGRVTTKIDVFAFGVILMELITGRKALDESLPDDKSHLVAWFRKHINHKDSIRTNLDPSLSPDDETFESIYKVAELSGHCTAREPLQRPDMGHAVNVLSPLVEQWKPTAGHERSDSLEIDLEVSLPQALQRWQANDEMASALSSGYHNSYRMGSLGRVHSSFRKHL